MDDRKKLIDNIIYNEKSKEYKNKNSAETIAVDLEKCAMDENELFEQGCFLPNWTTDQQEAPPISQVYIKKHKDLPTLLKELDEIKERIQEIQARQWQLSKKIYFHDNQFAEE